MKLGELDDEKSLKDASYYQELTFKALHEFILEESKRGSSVFKTILPIGSGFCAKLQEKGFSVSRSGDFKYISW